MKDRPELDGLATAMNGSISGCENYPPDTDGDKFVADIQTSKTDHQNNTPLDQRIFRTVDTPWLELIIASSSTELLDELWTSVFTYLSTHHLKRLAYVSKRFNHLANQILWHTPKLFSRQRYHSDADGDVLTDSPRLSQRADCEDLERLAHLPIRYLRTSCLEFRYNYPAKGISDSSSDQSVVLNFVELCKKKLTSLHGVIVDGDGEEGSAVSMHALRLLSPFICTLHMQAVDVETVDMEGSCMESLSELLTTMPRLESVVIDGQTQTHQQVLQQLDALAKLAVTEVHTCAVLTDGFYNSVEEFREINTQLVDRLKSMQSLRRIIVNSSVCTDLLDMFRDLPVTRIVLPNLIHLNHSHMGITDQLVDTLVALKSLSQVDLVVDQKRGFRNDHMFNMAELKMLARLPIVKLSTRCVPIFENAAVEAFVAAVEQMPTLEHLWIERDGNYSVFYKLDLASVQLMEHLPVTSIQCSYLDIRTDNIDEFIQTFRRMRRLESINLKHAQEWVTDYLLSAMANFNFTWLADGLQPPPRN